MAETPGESSKQLVSEEEVAPQEVPEYDTSSDSSNSSEPSKWRRKARKLWERWEALRPYNTFSLSSVAQRCLRGTLSRIMEASIVPPGYPIEETSTPYWVENTPFPKLLDTYTEIPSNHADIVIIGSGMAAAATAYTFFKESFQTGQLRRVLVLEARRLGSGATARHDGHIKFAPHEQFWQLTKSYGPKRAADLVRFRARHASILKTLCHDEAWDMAEYSDANAVELLLTVEDCEIAHEKVKLLQKWIPEITINIWNAEQAQERYRTTVWVEGAISYPDGALSPLGFVCCLWNDLLKEYPELLYIQTHTTAHSIMTPKNQEHPYDVVTSKGIVTCDHVVHATNAWATQLLPSMRGSLTGFLGNIFTQNPPGMRRKGPGVTFPLGEEGKRSWSVACGGKMLGYVAQQPRKPDRQPGALVFSGGFSYSQSEVVRTFNIFNDSVFDILPLASLLSLFQAIFTGVANVGGEFLNKWSGVVGVTGDALPFVGRLDPTMTYREEELPASNVNDRGDREASSDSYKTAEGAEETPKGKQKGNPQATEAAPPARLASRLAPTLQKRPSNIQGYAESSEDQGIPLQDLEPPNAQPKKGKSPARRVRFREASPVRVQEGVQEDDDMERYREIVAKARVKPGEWIAAGFNSDGMVWAWLCGTALGIMLASTEKFDINERPGRPGDTLDWWFPKELWITPQRLKHNGPWNLVNRVFWFADYKPGVEEIPHRLKRFFQTYFPRKQRHTIYGKRDWV